MKSKGDGRAWASWYEGDLSELLEQRRAGGVEVVQGLESHETRNFDWIMDPDRDKVELREPNLWDEKNTDG